MFRSTTIIRVWHISLAKVTFIQSVKVRRYGLCGCVAACYYQVHGRVCMCCVLCRVKFCTAHSTQFSKTDVKCISWWIKDFDDIKMHGTTIKKWLLIFLQGSFWYSQHRNCIPSSFSSSKSKLIFSEYTLNFLFNSSKYLCCVCDKADCAMVIRASKIIVFRILKLQHWVEVGGPLDAPDALLLAGWASEPVWTL